MGIDTAFVVKNNSESRPRIAIGTNNGRILQIHPNTRKRKPISPNEGFELYVDSVMQQITTQSHAFDVERMGTLDWNGDGTPEIFAIGNDLHWGIGRVVVLDENLNLLYDYWNPGKIRNAIAVNMDEDGDEELAVYGFNNKMPRDVPWAGTKHFYYGLTYTLLDRERPWGQAPEPFSVAPKAGKPGAPVWFLTWIGPAAKQSGIAYGFEIESSSVEGKPIPTVRFFQTLGLIINIDAKGDMVALRPDNTLPCLKAYFYSNQFPEPWLLKFMEKDGKLVEDTIFLKQPVIDSGWLKRKCPHVR